MLSLLARLIVRATPAKSPFSIWISHAFGLCDLCHSGAWILLPFDGDPAHHAPKRHLFAARYLPPHN